MLRIATVLAALAFPIAAQAQEPKGCDRFKWPIAREQALLAAATSTVASGSEVPLPMTAIRIALQPHETATLPMPPERAPKDKASFSGALRIAKIDKPGLYTVNLSANSWVDAIQNGSYLKTIAFSGATDCEGIRKSVKFQFTDAPLILQVSGVAADTLAIVIAPANE